MNAVTGFECPVSGIPPGAYPFRDFLKTAKIKSFYRGIYEKRN
jgi:hypothetical protein